MRWCLCIMDEEKEWYCVFGEGYPRCCVCNIWRESLSQRWIMCRSFLFDIVVVICIIQVLYCDRLLMHMHWYGNNIPTHNTIVVFIFSTLVDFLFDKNMGSLKYYWYCTYCLSSLLTSWVSQAQTMTRQKNLWGNQKMYSQWL